MRLSHNGSLSFQRALGLCLLLFWATTATQARFIAKRETPSVDIGVAATASDPDTLILSSESVNGSTEATPTTTMQNDSMKLEALTSTTTTESPILANNFNVSSTKPANVEVVTLVDAMQANETTTTTQQSEVEAEQPLKLPELTTTAAAAENEQEKENELTTAATTKTTEGLKSTQRSEDHARSMQFASSTENVSFLSPVTPMKLRPLPLTTTTRTTTHTPQLLAALLHAGVTVMPSASHENAIEEEEENKQQKEQQKQQQGEQQREQQGEQRGEQQVQPQPEKRAKYMSDNSTNAQQMSLPNVAEVWSLAGLKIVPPTATTTTTTTTARAITTTTAADLTNDIETTLQDRNGTLQHKEKNLLDWQQIMMMHTSQENRTEPVMSTTLDATEAATPASTTWKLDVNEMETSASSAVTMSTTNKTEESNLLWTTAGVKQTNGLAVQPPTTTEAITAEPELTAKVTATAITTAGLTELSKPNEGAVKESVSVSAITEASTTAKTELTELPKPSFKVIGEGASTESVKNTTESVISAIAATTAVSVENESINLATITTTTTAATTTTTTTTTAATTTTTAMPSALNATPTLNTNTNTNASAMAMKATTHENNENDVDADSSSSSNDSASNNNDVINVSDSVAVAVAVSESTTTTETTLAAITVSTRTAGEVNTTNTSPSTSTLTTTTTTKTPTLTPPPPPKTLHAKVDEQLAAGTTTTLATPTPTETVQISNEVNFETITATNVTNESNKNKHNIEPTSVDNSLLITAATTTSSETPPTTTVNSVSSLLIDNNSTLLTDEHVSSKLNEHETSLETNNISETAVTTTATTTTTVAAGTVPTTTTTTTEATTAAKVFNESKPIITTTASTTTPATTTAAKDEFEIYDDDEDDEQQQINHARNEQEALLNKTNMASTTTTAATTTSTTTTSTTATTVPKVTTTTEQPFISLLDDSTTTTTSSTAPTTTAPPTTTTTSTTTTTTPRAITTTTTTAESINSSTTANNNMLPIESTTISGNKMIIPTSTMIMPPYASNDLENMQQPHGNTGTDVNVIIAITVSVIGVVALILLVAFLYLMRKRQKQTSYGQRCRPVSLDAYSLDNVSVLDSVRRKGRDLRASKRTYGNAAFDDPSLRHNLLSATELGKFAERRSSIFEEFRDVPQIIAKADEVPVGCEDKNRYANVIPLPETRVVLQRRGDDDKTEYINANYVRGPRDAPNYYIACQAPLNTTTGDFWRMIWEQQTRVIVQATDLNENGIERCAEYLPPSVTLDNHSNYGDYQVTLKHREVKDKYAISTLMLKHVNGDESRELTHYWYKWPETGVPLEEAPIIAMLLEARSSLKSYALEQVNELKEKSAVETTTTASTALDNNSSSVETLKAKTEEGKEKSAEATVNTEINGNVANKQQQLRSQQGPLTVHCSPGTGRTGTIIACDMAIRSLETPKRSVDIPQLTYYVRRGRASAVQTKEQYEFIYKVANMYATKITNLSNDN